MTVGSSELEGSQSVLWVVERCSDQGLRLEEGEMGPYLNPKGSRAGLAFVFEGLRFGAEWLRKGL